MRICTNTPRSVSALLIAAAWLMWPVHTSRADFSIDFPAFDTAAFSQWTFNGSALDDLDSVDGQNALLLNFDTGSQAGTTFLTDPLSFANDYSFNAAFSVRLSGGAVVDCCGDPAGADGMTFVIHEDSRGDTALGGAGANMAIHNITPALIIEMDTWHSGIFDSGNTNVNGDHIALDINTADSEFPASIVQSGPHPLGAGLNDGEIKNLWVDYDGNTKNLQVFASESTTKPASPLLEQTVFLDRLFSGNDLYVGFSGATGGANNEHVVKSLSMSSQPSTSTEGPPPPISPDLSPSVPSPYSRIWDDFSDDSDWTLNGDARISGGRLRLTRSGTSLAGSAFLNEAIELPDDNAFNAFFSWEITNPGGSSDVDGPGADGLMLVIQADADKAEALGYLGGGFGFNGNDVAPPNTAPGISPAVAVEIDTWHNGTHDDAANVGVNGNHIAIDIAGEQESLAQFPPPGDPGIDPRFNDGGIYYTWVDYDGTNMQVYLSDSDTKPQDPLLDEEIDLSEALAPEGHPIINVGAPEGPQPVRFGFTAGTGAATNIHEIISFDLQVGSGVVRLRPGDADQNLQFDQLDLVKVQVAAKYLTGQPATWGEGDWNGAPGGSVGNPPPGDGLFNQIDVIAALNAGIYLTGPYGAIAPGGAINDEQTSIIYDPGTGELSVDAPSGTELTSINIDSASGIFTGDAAQNLGGSFDNDADDNIFKATFGSSFGSLSFGNVAQAGLSEQVVANDLTVVGSLAGGGDLGNVDLIYIPEPSAAFLALLGVLATFAVGRRR